MSAHVDGRDLRGELETRATEATKGGGVGKVPKELWDRLAEVENKELWGHRGLEEKKELKEISGHLVSQELKVNLENPFLYQK